MNTVKPLINKYNSMWLIAIHNLWKPLIIESVDSVSRDGPVCQHMYILYILQNITKSKISQSMYRFMPVTIKSYEWNSTSILAAPSITVNYICSYWNRHCQKSTFLLSFFLSVGLTRYSLDYCVTISIHWTQSKLCFLNQLMLRQATIINTQCTSYTGINGQTLDLCYHPYYLCLYAFWYSIPIFFSIFVIVFLILVIIIDVYQICTWSIKT